MHNPSPPKPSPLNNSKPYGRAYLCYVLKDARLLHVGCDVRREYDQRVVDLSSAGHQHSIRKEDRRRKGRCLKSIPCPLASGHPRRQTHAPGQLLYKTTHIKTGRANIDAHLVQKTVGRETGCNDVVDGLLHLSVRSCAVHTTQIHIAEVISEVYIKN